MKLRYTLRAAAELDEVLTDIAARSPQGARRVQARILAIITLLLQYPSAGQRTTKGRLRRIVASPYPYLIFYLATENEIVIHGVRHGRRNPSSSRRDDGYHRHLPSGRRLMPSRSRADAMARSSGVWGMSPIPAARRVPSIACGVDHR